MFIKNIASDKNEIDDFNVEKYVIKETKKYMERKKRESQIQKNINLLYRLMYYHPWLKKIE